MKVLLVEDEVRLTQALQHIAKKENIDMDVANDGADGLFKAQSLEYDVIILDIMLPEINGLEILKTLREDSFSTPILMLTARDSVEDRVTGLSLGADDYLPKPFATQELFARIRALGRRTTSIYHGEALSFMDVHYYIEKKIAVIDNIEFELPKKESEVLEMFLRRPNQILSKAQIFDRVWGYDSDVSENNIEIAIHFLRKKLLENSSVEIKTVRGSGYMLKEKADV